MVRTRVNALLCVALSLALGGEIAAAGEQDNQVFFYDVEGASASPIGSLLSLQDRQMLDATGDFERDYVWQRYHEYLLSTTRADPFLVLFTDDSCAVSSGEEEGEEGDAAVADPGRSCAEVEALNAKTVDAVAQSITKAFSLGVNVVHVRRQQFPQAFELHRIPASPSLMWLPPRSSGRFQRHSHPRTNFLDLSAHTLESTTDVDKTITSFVQRSYALSNLQPPSPTTKTRAPQVLERDESDDSVAASVLNGIVGLALLGFIGGAAFEHQELVMAIAQSRATWFLLMEGVLFVALSGMLHSIILRVPPFYAHPQHGFYFFHPSGRKQFLLEGLLSGSWSFVISFALFSIVDLNTHVPSRYVRDEVFSKGLIAIAASYMCLYVVFTSKYRWLA